MSTEIGMSTEIMKNKQSSANQAPFRVGLLSFSDGRLRVHETLAAAIKRNETALTEAIAKDPLLAAIPASEIVHSIAQAKSAVAEMRSANVEATVFNVPVFAFPNYSLMAARLLEMPCFSTRPRIPRCPVWEELWRLRAPWRKLG